MKHDLKNIPHFSLPAGYHFRLFSREEDANLWAKTVTKTDEFSNEENAIKRFNEEFLPHVSEVEKREVFMKQVMEISLVQLQLGLVRGAVRTLADYIGLKLYQNIKGKNWDAHLLLKRWLY